MIMIKNIWITFSLLCLIYTGVVLSVRSGTFSFTIWIALSGIFAIFAYLAYGKNWNNLMPILRYMICAVSGILFVIFVICQTAIISHSFDKGKNDLDYIVVLGAQMRGNNPSIVYRYRLDKAFEYLMANENTICILTGGKGANETISEGEGGRDYLLSRGITTDRLIVEKESRDTVENIRNAFNLMADNVGAHNKIGIVTNSFHVFRGVRIAKRYTSDEVCGIAAYMQPLYMPNNMVRETFGILRDFVNGNM
ncbi:MAG: YdcF family protein [Lachnospiraceae bacterium]|nr:YdcF family protein [Lachnospiraceae bacterium]